MPQRSWEWYLDVAKTETDPKKKAELISLGNLSEALARTAHRREVEATAKRPARKRRPRAYSTQSQAGEVACPGPGESPSVLPIDVDRGIPAIASPARKVKERADNSADAVTRLSEVTDKMTACSWTGPTRWWVASKAAQKRQNWRR